MASEQEQTQEGVTTSGRRDDGHHLARVAAIAAASGATAYATRKLLAGRSTNGENGSRGTAGHGRGGVDAASLVEAAVSSGWDVARDSLIPVIEDAATRAGCFLGERAPDLIRDVVAPRFIAGFEKAGGRTGRNDDPAA